MKRTQRIHVLKVPEGWRVAIEDNQKTEVLENTYDDEQEAIIAAASLL